MRHKCSIISLSALLVIWLSGVSPRAAAQDVVRLEIEASDLALPFYTLPVGRQGVVLFRGVEIRNRRVVIWEMLHYDVAFRLKHRERFHLGRNEHFAGWKSDGNHIAMVFFQDQLAQSGNIIVYDIAEKQFDNRGFELGDLHLVNPVFRLADGHFYLCGLHTPGVFNRLFRRAGSAASQLVSISGSLEEEGKVHINQWNMDGLRRILHAQPDLHGKGLLLALESDVGRHLRGITTVALQGENLRVLQEGEIFSKPEAYITSLCFLSTDSISLAMAGSYGTITRREWRNNNPVTAKGLFFASLDDTDQEEKFRLYPFHTFRHLMRATTRRLAQTRQSSSRQRGEQTQPSFNILLHDAPYQQNDLVIIAGETYFPEYEYDQRVQHFYMPYAYYGYHPGFYDRGGRWVFKGFRYEYAIIAAFDPTGNLVWENSFEASDILDRQLMKRINLLPYDDEVVMVYAHEGRVWYRVIRAEEVLVDRDSMPIELPDPGDRAREHHAMNMAPWYDNFFVVWGRQMIRNTDGHSRTVFYCNKIAFE